ncbi:response regulator transcription factor [Herbiconiux sp. CPCC 205763]|uniref:Response regulator transcription factor n=1 Tax=Herbiconiux aconitum TaxID=2970913 RepID=A0ABT2GP27_9MICO|nr:response regulator transcription factor [Herbiconiux aconitum]MCS5717988.1 response regulator transcription factor [Herbiconiux aconitum]
MTGTAGAATGAGGDVGGSRIRLLVADDQALVRGALAALLGLEPDIEVVAEAGTGREAVDLAIARQADVAMLDVEMPELDGISAAAELREALPGCRVLMVTTFGRPGYVRRALQAGATGFVVKDTPARALAAAVRDVARGIRVIDPVLAAETLTSGDSPLTEREEQVLAVARTGGTIADISRSLHLSEGTVRNYLSSAMGKAGARTRAEAVRIAESNGWLL